MPNRQIDLAAKYLINFFLIGQSTIIFLVEQCILYVTLIGLELKIKLLKSRENKLERHGITGWATLL